MGTNDAEDTTVDMNVTERTPTNTTDVNAVDGSELGSVRRWIEALDDPAVRSIMQCALRHNDDAPWYTEDHISCVTDRDEIHSAIKAVVNFGLLERRVVDGEPEYRPITNSPVVRACKRLELVYRNNLPDPHPTD